MKHTQVDIIFGRPRQFYAACRFSPAVAETETETELFASRPSLSPGTEFGIGNQTDLVPTTGIRNSWIHGSRVERKCGQKREGDNDSQFELLHLFSIGLDSISLAKPAGSGPSKHKPVY